MVHAKSSPRDGERRLVVADHDRGSLGRTYVYAVVSRRAAGVSIGVNLNPNNACNWRCVYCQVPGLLRGNGPTIDLDRLRAELDATLDDVLTGDFMSTRVPEGLRVLRDVAFSGNGEPTTSPSFAAAVDLVVDTLENRDLLGEVRLTLITNGTMMGKPEILEAARRMADAGGQVWFKLDAATPEAAARNNGQSIRIDRHVERLRQSASACETWVQTCMFSMDGAPPPEHELEAYLSVARTLVEDGTPIAGVLLYTLARPSHQPEAPRLASLPESWLQAFAARIEALGLRVRVHV